MRTFAALSLLCMLMTLTACKKGPFPDNAPYYPGALVGGRQSWQMEGYTLAVNVQQTPDDAQKVLAYFTEKLSQRPNWKKLDNCPSPCWSDGGLVPGTSGNTFEPKPVDPARPGRLIMVTGFGATDVQIWVSLPKGK